MPDSTPGYAKNIVGRALRAKVDPEPKPREKKQIWEFFHSECAFCGTVLIPGSGAGHIDHLVAHSRGGSNHISNRVLACRTCDSVEKLDSDWQKFLVKKNPDKKQLARRRNRIEQWTSMNGPAPSFDSDLILREKSTLDSAIDAAVDRINRSKE